MQSKTSWMSIYLQCFDFCPPGGVREAYFSDEYYELLWGNRCGFAKIALEAEVVNILTYYIIWKDFLKILIVE